MKWGLMRQVVLLVAATLLINAVIMTVMFTTTSRNVYANMRLDELLPHANYVGALTSLYHQGGLSMNVFEMLINQDTNLRNMDIYIFHSDGTLLASPVQAKNSIDKTELQQYALSVMDKESENSDAPTGEGVAVGVPVYGSDGEAVGAVVAVRSILELDAALSGLNRAVLASTTVAMLIMLIPVFFASRRISNPLRQMSTVARAMSEGDFSIKAAETNRGEVGALGTSLNELSEKLSRSIGDLVLERNRLQNVIDGLQEGIIAIDANNEITHFNPAAIILLDGTEDMDIIDLPQVKSLIDDAKATVEDGEQRDRQISVGDTEITVTTTQLLNQRGSSAGAVLLLQDVTRAVRLEQTRREYVANVSHELRTPIASIRGLADALNDGMVKKEEDKQRYYGYILRESMRLSRLINDLLELSRLQSGGMALKKEKVNMHDLMRELKDRFSEVAEECGLTFVCDLPGEGMACSNEDRVEQVLVALLDNAIKYSDVDSEVALSIEENDDHYVVSVSNSGEISKEDLPQIFDRFYKADKSHSGGGTGLGLAIAHEIMTRLGEKIWVTSNDGQVRFSFTLKKI